MRTRNQSTTKSQIDKANSILRALAINVTTEDKREAAKKFQYHDITIRRYLKGQGGDLDTATKLIDFLGKRIEDRDKILHKA